MSKIIKNNISYAGAEDNKVKQNETSTNASYEVLLSGTADNTTRSEEARKSEKLTFNPDEGGLTVDGNITVNSDSNVSALTVFGSYTDTRPAFTVTPDDEGGAGVQLFKSDMPAVFIAAHNHTADPNDSEDEDRIGGEISLNGTSGFNTVNLDGQTGTITVSNPLNATPTITLNGANGGITATSLNGVTIGSSPKFTDTTYTSKAATSGGTDVSLCTTGEKYNWNRTNQVLPGYKVRVVTKDFSSLAITSSAGNVYVCANQTLTVATSSLGSITTLIAVFGTSYLTSGTTATWVGIQAAYISNSNLIINYTVYRHTSNTLSNVRVRFLVIGT